MILHFQCKTGHFPPVAIANPTIVKTDNTRHKKIIQEYRTHPLP